MLLVEVSYPAIAAIVTPMASTRKLKPKDLVLAATSGDCRTLLDVLKYYPAEIDTMHDGMTALQGAASNGHIDVMKILIRYDADLHHGDNCTPLHYAVRGNQPEAVCLLLKSGANWKETDEIGFTAYDLAFEKKYNDCLKAFHEFDPDIALKVLEENVELEETEKDDGFLNLDESPTEIQSTTDEDDPSIMKCYYCQENAACIQFEPCNCIVSCLECCLTAKVCQECFAPIEKKSLPEISVHLKNYIENARNLRSEVVDKADIISMLQNRVEKLEEFLTCPICKDVPVRCTLSCGHMFCIDCVKRQRKRKPCWPKSCGYCKGTNGTQYLPPHPECPNCKKSSSYTVLYPLWPYSSSIHSSALDRVEK